MTTLNCNNKGCFKLSLDSLLDIESNEVICSECGKPILGVTEFLKNSIRGMGKIVKDKERQSLAVNCKKCGRYGQPVLENDTFLCFNCKEPMELTDQFKKMLRDYIRNAK